MFLPRVLIKRLKSSKKPVVIVFSSFVHGSGKSALCKSLEKALARKGLRVLRIYIGRIFRKMAIEAGKSIDEFMRDLNKNPEVDLEVDKRMYCVLKNLLRKNYYRCILVDSSVAPYYLDGKKIFKVYIYSNLSLVAKRVLLAKREADPKYKDEKEIINSLLVRSIEDYKRYKSLAKKVSDPFWKKVYSRYGSWIFDLRHSNQETLNKSLRKLVLELSRLLSIKGKRVL